MSLLPHPLPGRVRRPVALARSGLVAAALAVAATLAVSAPASAALDPGAAAEKACTVSAKLVPSCGAWWGVSPDGHRDIAKGVADFEKLTQARTDMYRGYHGVGQMFPTAHEVALARDPKGKRILLLSLNPTTTGLTWGQVAAGREDAYLDRLAAHIKATYREKFLLILHHEPENDVVPRAGSGMQATDFRNMFRHVSQRLEAKGATNALMTVVFQGTQKFKTESWWPQMYPGDDVVDWLGWDSYSCVNPEPGKACLEYKDIVNRRFSERTPWQGMYSWATRNHPGKPIVIAELGVYAAGGKRQADAIRSAARQVADFPAIKAISYWNAGDGKSAHISWENSSVAAARQLAGAPYFRMQVP